MATVTPAHTRLRDLTPHQQDAFEAAMEGADLARDNTIYAAFMTVAARTIGLDVPRGTDIRACSCSCVCGHIFITRDDTHVIEHSTGYNLGRLQCDDCADTHRETA